LQIPLQIPWKYERRCVLVPLDRSRAVRALRGGMKKNHGPQASKADAFEFIPGPMLRAKLGISAVTLWRWRHDKKCGFPAPKVINGRLYFPVTAVSAWIARQRDAA
jgi:predicted DNA-binding transcriptional regulator AlpA